jgi:hypothetical protein
MLPKAATALEGMLSNPISKPPIVAIILLRAADFLSRTRKGEKLKSWTRFFQKSELRAEIL